MITKFLGNAHKHRVESCYWHWSYTEKSIEILIFFLDDQEISFSQTLLHDFFLYHFTEHSYRLYI